MPKPTFALKATVTQRPSADPVDQPERQLQAEHHQAAEADTAAGASISTEPAPSQDLEPAPEPEGSPYSEPEKSQKQRKREEQWEANAVQAAFLTGNLGRPVVIFLVNGLRLTGRLKQFDQFTVLLQGPDGLNSLIFKHAITAVTPTC